ncbi:MAG: hypothetical protein AAGF74_10525 [Pseudomonadota bacterium]
MPSDDPKKPAFLLPWRVVLLFFAALCLVVGFAYLVAGLPYVAGAVSGLILGFFGSIFGDRTKAVWAITSVAALAAVAALTPDCVSVFLLAPGFAALAGLELARFGTRVTIFAIMSWIILHSPVSAPAHPALLLPIFAGSAAIGIALAGLLGATRRVPPITVESGYAIAHAMALAIGLVLAQIIATRFDTAQSHWIALLFAARALDPPGSHVTQAASRGAAMVVGAGIAGLLVNLPLGVTWFALAVIAMLLVGLRYLPSGMATSSALMSAGIVLASSPTEATALFRAEATVIASLLVVFVFIISAAIRRAFLPTRPA